MSQDGGLHSDLSQVRLIGQLLNSATTWYLGDLLALFSCLKVSQGAAIAATKHQITCLTLGPILSLISISYDVECSNMTANTMWIYLLVRQVVLHTCLLGQTCQPRGKDSVINLSKMCFKYIYIFPLKSILQNTQNTNSPIIYV